MNDVILLQDNTLIHPVNIPLVDIFVKKNSGIEIYSHTSWDTLIILVQSFSKLN